MKKRFCIFFLIIGALLFACENPKVENAALNVVNKTENQNISGDGVDAAVVYVQDGSRDKPGAMRGAAITALR